jgi:hypothetical protein
MSDINELRKVLFDTLTDLRNKDKTIDIDRAKAINDTAKNIIDSAKVEVDFMRVAGGQGSGFIGQASALKTPTATGTKTVEQKAGYSVTTHQLK